MLAYVWERLTLLWGAACVAWYAAVTLGVFLFLLWMWNFPLPWLWSTMLAEEASPLPAVEPRSWLEAIRAATMGQKLVLTIILWLVTFPWWARFLIWLQLGGWASGLEWCGRRVLRFYQRWTPGTKTDEGEITLLPSQQEFVDSLDRLLDSAVAVRPGPLIGVRGDWGTGKSFLLRYLRQKWEADRGPRLRDLFRSRTNGASPGGGKKAVVWVNIWQEETQPDLHYTIVRRVLSHPRILWRCLRYYPPAFAFSSLCQRLGRLLPEGMKLSLKVSSAAVDTRVAVPLWWHEALARAARGWKKQGMKVVVVLDEIDRADPPMAQAAVTLSRRALELPGITVVLPYVEEQMLYKVFNPVLAHSPDLFSSMSAVLYGRFMVNLDSVACTDPADIIRQYTSHGSASADGKAEAGNGANRARGAGDARVTLGEAVDLALMACYLGSEGNEVSSVIRRRRLAKLFTEKYLGRSLDIPELRPDDVGPLLHGFEELKPWSDAVGQLRDDRIAAAVNAYMERRRLNKGPQPAVRALAGELVRLQSKAPRDVNPHQVLCLVLAAYLTTALQRTRFEGAKR